MSKLEKLAPPTSPDSYVLAVKLNEVIDKVNQILSQFEALEALSNAKETKVSKESEANDAH